MTDWVGAAEVAFSGFFVVLAVVLLVRYRQASEAVAESSELNRDLWGALEARLKQQDERLVDLLAKLEVVQARVAAERGSAPLQIQPQTSQLASQNITPSQTQVQPLTQPRPLLKPAPTAAKLDPTEKAALRFLSEGPRKTPELMAGTGRSREHTARLMRSLYDRGLVERDESSKPFVYRLTEKGRGLVSGS